MADFASQNANFGAKKGYLSASRIKLTLQKQNARIQNYRQFVCQHG
jgi:hypothetical protein